MEIGIELLHGEYRTRHAIGQRGADKAICGGHEEIGGQQFLDRRRRFQRVLIGIDDVDDDEAEARRRIGLAELKPTYDFAETRQLFGGNIDHIVAAMAGENGVEDLHLAGDQGEINERRAPGKKPPEGGLHRVEIEAIGIAALKQKEIHQHTGQQGLTVAVPVGTDDGDQGRRGHQAWPSTQPGWPGARPPETMSCNSFSLVNS